MLGSVILCETFRRISQLWDDALTLNLENCLLYLLSTISQSFGFVHCIVFDFIFYCVTAHTLYSLILKCFRAKPKLIQGDANGFVKKPLNYRPRSIYQYSGMAPRLSGQNCKFFKFPLSLNSQQRLKYKENNTKYRGLN